MLATNPEDAEVENPGILGNDPATVSGQNSQSAVLIRVNRDIDGNRLPAMKRGRQQLATSLVENLELKRQPCDARSWLHFELEALHPVFDREQCDRC